jgi:hypothetical protein
MKPYDPYLPVHLRKARDELQQKLEDRKPKATPSLDEEADRNRVAAVVRRLNPFTPEGRNFFKAFKERCAAKQEARAQLPEQERMASEAKEDAERMAWAEEADRKSRAQHPHWKWVGYAEMIRTLKARVAPSFMANPTSASPPTASLRPALERMREQVPRPPSAPTIPGGNPPTPHFQPGDDDKLAAYRDQIERLDWHY